MITREFNYINTLLGVRGTSGKRQDDFGNSPGKYDVENFTYPRDLFSDHDFVEEERNSGNENVNAAQNPYGRSWVMFNINVQATSRDNKPDSVIDLSQIEKEKGKQVVTENQARGMSNPDNSLAQGTGLAVGGAAALASLLGGGSASDVISTGLKAGATAGLIAGVNELEAGQSFRQTKRLKSSIQLPMPNELATKYGMEWNADSTALFDLMARSYDIFKDITGGTDSMRDAGKVVSGVLSAGTLGFTSAVDMGALSAATGLASNSKKEMIFQGVGFRTFAVSYVFHPKSKEENTVVHNIINLFKYHMHPEFKGDYRTTFIYPSEFDITFYTDYGYENEYVARIGTCVLRDMDVNYTPTGNWAAHDEGAPNLIKIDLVFQELGINTKETIEQGF